MPFALFQTWMDLEMMILSEVSQTEKDMPYNITYVRNLKYDTNEFIYKAERLTDKNPCGCPRGGWIGNLGSAESVSCWLGFWVLCFGPSSPGILCGRRADPGGQRSPATHGCRAGEGKPIWRQDPRLP